MIRLPWLGCGARRQLSTADRAARDAVLEQARWELVPVKSVEAAIQALPPASRLSVTCSPVKGLQHTLDLTAQLLDAGHDAVPHIAVRLVESREHTASLAQWCREHGATRLFVIGGDESAPVGPYGEVLTFLRDFFQHDSGVVEVGVAGYPDGHPSVDRATLTEVLLAKQQVLADAGVTGWVSTQMCFDAKLIERWLVEQRRGGLTLPVRLGVPGAVERAKLLSLGTRLGIGASLRYLRKNRAVVTRLAAPGGYDPLELIDAMAPRMASLGITGMHVFTFNATEATLRWWNAALQRITLGSVTREHVAQ